jgi:hypothetical protein
MDAKLREGMKMEEEELEPPSVFARYAGTRWRKGRKGHAEKGMGSGSAPSMRAHAKEE